MKTHFSFLKILILITMVSSCCKDKNDCKQDIVEVSPFIEKAVYFCNGNAEFSYILRKKIKLIH